MRPGVAARARGQQGRHVRSRDFGPAIPMSPYPPDVTSSVREERSRAAPITPDPIPPAPAPRWGKLPGSTNRGAVDVDFEVVVEVSVAHEGAELEDGFGAVQAPPGAGGTLGIAGHCPAIADTQGGMRMYEPNYRPNYDDATRDNTERLERQERQQSEGGLAEDEDSAEREIAEHDRRSGS